MTANRLETGTKEKRMTIKSKRGGGSKNITEPFKGRGDQVNLIATPPFPPGDKIDWFLIINIRLKEKKDKQNTSLDFTLDFQR